jgi:Monooxygenase af470-like
MRVNTLVGIKTLFGMGPRISQAVAAKPDGLLLHENVLYSLRHVGMRQYWRDYESLEAWSRSEPHRLWWQNFLRDSGGTGFWHETYFRRGGMEAVYLDMKSPAGMAKFAPLQPARGAMFSARRRAGVGGEPGAPGAVSEEQFYSD